MKILDTDNSAKILWPVEILIDPGKGASGDFAVAVFNRIFHRYGKSNRKRFEVYVNKSSFLVMENFWTFSKECLLIFPEAGFFDDDANVDFPIAVIHGTECGKGTEEELLCHEGKNQIISVGTRQIAEITYFMNGAIALMHDDSFAVEK